MESMGDNGHSSSHSPQHKILSYDLDSGFEPQTRARSNTWPLPRPEGYVDSIGKEGIVDGNGSLQQQTLGQGASSLMPAVKKNSSRRNAWGNLSYADLITQAITSAPEKRLTLSQIYEWMVQNVPYFKDKGDSNSSAGWKNSIRHNLSLHNRFMRVQNEGTGKSSWWMINPDAKPGKSARRRATSMEANNYEKRRGRAKKRVENVRNNVVQADAASSPSSSVSEGLDLFSESPLHTTSGFPLSPEFRPRASSNASSAGRLSPIPSHMNETEWPISNYVASYSPEQLAGNLAKTMKLEPYQMQYQSPPPPPPNHQQPTVQPPSYFEAQYQINSMRNPTPSYAHSTCRAASQQRCSIHLHPCSCSMNSNSVADLSPTYQQSDSSSSPLNGVHQSSQQPKKPVQQQKIKQRSPQTIGRSSSPPQTPPSVPSAACTMMGQLMGALNSNLLDDLNISIEGLQGGFDCNVDEVIKHELSMDGTLDFNFQHGLIDSTSIHVNNTDITQGNAITSNNPVTSISGNAPTDIYVSTNPTTPSVLNPSWVH